MASDDLTADNDLVLRAARDSKSGERTHYCDWDEPGRRFVRALCGARISRTAHDNDPSCPFCREGLAYRARVGSPA